MAFDEVGDGHRQERRARAGEARDPHLAALEAGDRGEFALGLLETGDRRVGVIHQHAAGVGGQRALAGALQELHPDLALEGRHLLADGRLRQVERLGGGRERAPGRDLTQDPQPLHIKHKVTLSDLTELPVALISLPSDHECITNDRCRSFRRRRRKMRQQTEIQNDDRSDDPQAHRRRHSGRAAPRPARFGGRPEGRAPRRRDRGQARGVRPDRRRQDGRGPVQPDLGAAPRCCRCGRLSSAAASPSAARFGGLFGRDRGHPARPSAPAPPGAGDRLLSQPLR